VRDIFEYTFTIPNRNEDVSEGLGTYDEVEKIVKNEINFEDLDKEIDYTT